MVRIHYAEYIIYNYSGGGLSKAGSWLWKSSQRKGKRHYRPWVKPSRSWGRASRSPGSPTYVSMITISTEN